MRASPFFVFFLIGVPGLGIATSACGSKTGIPVTTATFNDQPPPPDGGTGTAPPPTPPPGPPSPGPCETPTNLVKNGDFSNGNNGFSSQYTYVSLINSETEYTVATNPNTSSVYGWPSFGDHTTGNGEMLIANGATFANQAVWSEMVNVKAQTPYTFSFWATNVDPTRNSTNSGLAVLVGLGGITSLGTPVTVDLTAGVWTKFSGTFEAEEATSVVLSIEDNNLVAGNNDFAIDDVSFAGCE